MKTTRLIVLRGPSGAGKSTTAKHLFSEAKDGTALIEQDHYRFIFKPAGGRMNTTIIHQLILHNVLTALENGYDVILEGIFKVRVYSDLFTAIFREHPMHNYLFYFNVSLDESIRRHRTRETANLSTEQEMRGWYKDKDLLGYDFEYVIPESSSPAETLANIRHKTGLSSGEHSQI